MSVVLVTGAGGFVGSAVVRRLVRGGGRFADGSSVEQVVALLRPGGFRERLVELPRDGRWSIEHADLRDARSLEPVLARTRPRAVIHAGLDPAVYETVDERLVRPSLETLIGGLGDAGDARFLQVGSAWVLASGSGLDESAPLAPRSPYARNKATADELVSRLAGEAGVPWINLRLFNVFGRYEKETRLVPTLVSKLSRDEPVELTSGDQIRDFTDVDAAAGAFVAALAAPDEACGSVYHVGSGVGTSVRALALLVAEHVGDPGLIRFGASDAQDSDVPELVADPSRARDVLGWRPDPDLRARVRDAVAWWQARLAHTSEGVTA